MGFENFKKFFREAEQAQKQPERSIEDIERELKGAKEERAELGNRYGTIKESGGSGSVVQRKIFDTAEKIKNLQEELEGRYGKKESQE